MRRSFFLFIVLASWVRAVIAQIPDSQVMRYVQEGQAVGKTEKQLIKEFRARGVTMAQVERIKKRLEGHTRREYHGEKYGSRRQLPQWLRLLSI